MHLYSPQSKTSSLNDFTNIYINGTRLKKHYLALKYLMTRSVLKEIFRSYQSENHSTEGLTWIYSVVKSGFKHIKESLCFKLIPTRKINYSSKTVFALSIYIFALSTVTKTSSLIVVYDMLISGIITNVAAFGRHKDPFILSVISQHWDGAGSWNISSWTPRT